MTTKEFKTRWNNGGGNQMISAGILGLTAAQLFDSMRFPTSYANDFIGKYGTNNYGQIDGINYQQFNDIDTVAERNRMSKIRDSKILSGATTGATTGLAIGSGLTALLGSNPYTMPLAILGGLFGGGLLGGIFGNESKHEEEERMWLAQVRLNNFNESSRTDALAKSLRRKELELYGDLNNQSLYSNAALGDEKVNPKTKQTVGKFNVHTSNGIEHNNQNAWLNDGEWVRNKKKGTEHFVVGNPNKIDGERARLRKGDDVFSNTLTIPGTNITFAQAYPMMKSMGKDDELLAIQPIARKMVGKNKESRTLPHAWGGIENVLATVPGMILSWRDYNSIANDDIHRTKLNPFNKYEGIISDLMGGRRVTAYPQMRAITNEEGALRYRINLSGGLSSMLKVMSNITNSLGTKMAKANALFNTQLAINQFNKETAEMLDKLGTSLMSARQQADIFNEQNNAAAHASMMQGLNMAKRNILDYVGQFAKNAWERDQFNKMYGLYAQDVASRNPVITRNVKTPGISREIATVPYNDSNFKNEFNKEWGLPIPIWNIRDTNDYNIAAPVFPSISITNKKRKKS